jgi:radical SAM superfamily enzyme YgiQ (UPF0313 family)
LKDDPGEVAATLIPSVGCPMGCNFCSTSAMFGGKGRFINFYETGDELFEVMRKIEREMKASSFFVMDENFLLHKKRALRLLELMEEHGKSWSLYVFSSANVLRSYTTDQLVRLGISWVWMGLEGEDSRYQKLAGADTKTLVRTLQENGISILGSTIIGLEEHTPENIDDVIRYAVEHATEFHQFMLYTPVPGTPLFQEHKDSGTLVDPECLDTADAHGQLKFVHKHPNIPAGAESEFLLRAFQTDFDVNGPSITRMARTTLRGWKRFANDPNPRVRARFRREGRTLPVTHAASLAAAIRWFHDKPEIRDQMKALLKELHAEFGIRSRIASWIGGPYLFRRMKAEAKALAAGVAIEPPTFYELTENFVSQRPKAEPGKLPAAGEEPLPCGGVALACARGAGLPSGSGI